MRFEAPLALLLLAPALLTVWLVARNGMRVVPSGQHRIATVVRSVAVTLLVLALAQPLLVRSSQDRTVLFLVDRSSSITAGAAQAQDDYLAAAIAAAGSTDRTAVAVFGRDVRLDQALTAQPVGGVLRTVIDASGTDLAGALRSSAAILPTEGSRRIVLLTDGAETIGSVRSVLTELESDGIAVDVVTLESGQASDAIVTAVDAPATARVGDDVPVAVEIRSTSSGPGVVSLDTGAGVLEVPVDLEPGINRVEITVPSVGGGVLQLDASVSAPFDTVPENDTGQALVGVLGPAQVAVVEGRQGEADDLARALEAGGVGVDVLPAIPTAAELLSYDGVVLVNVPAPPDAVAEDLAAFVEHLGRGLVVVGGDQAFGLGDYQDTALEELLPVTSDPDELIRRQPVAQVLVIDTSGSMADCHCDGVSDHDPSMQGGVNKTDISRLGAGLAIQALQDTDRIGVLAFTSGTRWALPLATKPSGEVVASALGSLVPQGDTEIAPALREALASLDGAPEEIRHIVLFTDGWGDDPDLLDAARDIAEAGITLSVLGTGEGSGEQLRRAASLGGGQFYRGEDLSAVPEIFVEETLRVARPLVAEGSFLPALGAASPVTAGMTSAPPLGGYVLTRLKPTAALPLEVGPGDPLLATWQRGLGRATVWTSDATARWSSNWVTWDGFVDFWGRLVGDVLPAGRDTPPAVRLDGGALNVSYDAEAPLDAVAIAQVRSADGSVTSVPLQRTGESHFEGTVPVPAEGAYWVAVTVEGQDGVVASGSSGVVAGYAEEFAFREPDGALAADIADATGGRVDAAPEEVYQPAPGRGAAETALWPWLVAAALALFLADVVLRRLVVRRGDFTVWRQAVTADKKPVEALVTTPRASGAPAPGEPSPDQPPPPPREMLPEEETLSHLLRRKRK